MKKIHNAQTLFIEQLKRKRNVGAIHLFQGVRLRKGKYPQKKKNRRGEIIEIKIIINVDQSQ